MNINHCEGLFVGLLKDDELEEFDRQCREMKARRSYEGGGGFMGLAKVRFIRPVSQSPSDHSAGQRES